MLKSWFGLVVWNPPKKYASLVTSFHGLDPKIIEFGEVKLKGFVVEMVPLNRHLPCQLMTPMTYWVTLRMIHLWGWSVTLGPSMHLDTLITLLDTKDFVSGGSFIRTLCRTKPFELLGGFNSVERSCMFLPLKWS